MRIGLLYPAAQPLDPRNWSGTPAGLAGGLAANGVDLVPLAAAVPPGLHQGVALASRLGGHRGAVADRMPVRQWARTRALHRSVQAAGPLDAIVAMGTEMYDLRAAVAGAAPCISYDDGTLAQMWANPESDISQAGFADRHVRAWIGRQAASSGAAQLCAVSTRWAAASFAADYLIDPERIAVVGMGHRPRTAAAGNRSWDTPRYLFVGVDWQRKNGAAVLEAFARVRQDFPAATLDVVGGHPALDAPGVTGHGMISRDDAPGQRTLDGLYAAATCFVLPSRFDPSPISCLEAGSAGLPVIATTVGGAAELLPGGSLVVDPLDTGAIAAAMRTLADPARARSMGAAARQAAANCSWQHVGARILDAALALPRQGAPAHGGNQAADSARGVGGGSHEGA
ncbi:glycosyltransferase involved in cell wall biosynthesis [Arthrobacter stackebrandtii]|uniref:Glycosyltransferase involved in cell wall biosynthesis n=1 Tax=Arthrobacter stackebrandtii TaxID=272161 RepID=A0ABS4YS32_9MICC|nr:glycosyltransferase family 4 protein [Arthrobacter stackebrandtii]MBP2411554.1 glycosyltransferase involved in cell wall biosynthesis [Arthrobacter stackebrandtii]PYG99234.1 hypothetical protein CVV67_16035 [Arthrobacter stackebrandtii]